MTASPSQRVAETSAEKQASPKGSWAEVIKDSYLVFDRRTLGLTRICLGFYLIMDLFRRTPDWQAMFGGRGVLPPELSLSQPMADNFTLVHGFVSRPELWGLWAVILASYLLLLVGYKTKIWQVLAVLFVTSMNGRVLLIENGGYVVQNLVVLWTAFLPLGSRFSVDSMLRSRRASEGGVSALNARRWLEGDPHRAPFYSLVGLAITLQFSVIYYFNVIHKTGPAWHDGTAVHYVLYNDRMATPIVAAVREYIPFWFIKIATPLVLTVEAAIPYAVLLPRLWLRGVDLKPWFRRTAVAMICFLHLIFGSSFVLGPFAWALCVFSTVLFTSTDWELAIAAMKRPERRRTVIVDDASAFLRRAAAVLARLDAFEQLTFESASTASERASGITVRRPSGEVVSGHRAIAEAVRALPLGPLFSWMVALLPARSIVDSTLAGGREKVSRFLGLSLESRAAPAASSATEWQRARGFARAGVREAIVFAMMSAAIVQALNELWTTKKPWSDLITSLNQTGPLQTMSVKLSPQPEVMRQLSQKLRFLQGWFMFSPNPVMDDGTIVVDAVTADGRHIDPFWDTTPNFDLKHAKSLRYNQIWSDYFNRMHYAGNGRYRNAMVDYMRRLPERTKNDDDRLVSGQVYWLSDMNPKWGTHESWNEQRELLFSFSEDGGAVAPPKPVIEPN